MQNFFRTFWKPRKSKTENRAQFKDDLSLSLRTDGFQSREVKQVLEINVVQFSAEHGSIKNLESY